MKYQVEERKGKHFLIIAGEIAFELDEAIAEYIHGNRKLSGDLQTFVDNFLSGLDCPTKVDCPYELKSAPLVSVILINYNGKDYNEICLESLFEQSYKKIEIIMVNNLSTDGSIDIVREKYPKVKIIDPRENTGFAKGNNIGVSHAKGEYLLIVNNDTELEKDAVKNLVAFAQHHSAIGAIAAKMMFFWNKNVINSFGNTVFLDNWGSDNFINFIDIGQFNLPRQVMSACFGAVFIPRKVWEKVGELDEKMFMYYEDSDWSYRARLLGYDIVASPYSVVYHKFGASTSIRPSAFKNKMVIRNRLIWAIKNLGKRMCLFAIKNYVKADINDSLRFLKRKDLSVFTSYFVAYSSLLILLPRILLDRIALQKKRSVTDKEILSLSVPINQEIYLAVLPKLTVRTLRKYYSENALKIQSANWLNLKDNNWQIWRDNTNFLVNTNESPDDLFFHFSSETEGEFNLFVQGLFAHDVKIRLNGRVLKLENSLSEHGIEETFLGKVKLQKWQNELVLNFQKSSEVSYLGTISFRPVWQFQL